MNNNDTADTAEKRDGVDLRGAAKKARKTARRSAGASGLESPSPFIKEGLTSLDRLCAWLSPGDHKVSVANVRKELIAKGIDLSRGVSVHEATPHVVDMLLKTLYTSTLDIKRDKARAAAAAADTAEIELEELKGNLVSRDAVRRLMEDAIATYREKIRFLDGLTLEQRVAVCEQLVNLQIDQAERQP